MEENLVKIEEPKVRKLIIFGKEITILKVQNIEEPRIFNVKAVIKKTPRYFLS
jgi:hypothetical protein